MTVQSEEQIEGELERAVRWYLDAMLKDNRERTSEMRAEINILSWVLCMDFDEAVEKYAPADGAKR